MIYRPLNAFLVGSAILLLAACAQKTPEADRVYLEAAQEAAAWIGSTAVETPHGPICGMCQQL